jgi:Glycosyl transferase family 2
MPASPLRVWGRTARSVGSWARFEGQRRAAERAPQFRAQSDAVRRGMELPDLPTRQGFAHQLWAVTMVKDEADIIESSIRHLFEQGVSGVLVADNGSTDETPAILNKLSRELNLYLARDREPAYYQDHKMSLLADWARRAGAGWIIPFDADEFWWAPVGTLAQWLRSQDAAVVQARIHNVFPAASAPAGWALDAEPHLHPKVAFKAYPKAFVQFGNHSVRRPGAWAQGLLITHVPWRSFEQFSRKLRNGAAVLDLASDDELRGSHWRTAGRGTDAQLATMWHDLESGHDEPDIGWSPVGPMLPLSTPPPLTNPYAAVPPPVLYPAAQPPLTILYTHMGGFGWDSVTVMVRLAAQMLDAHLEIATATHDFSRLTKVRGLIPRRHGSGHCLVIAPQPAQLNAVLTNLAFLRGYERVAGWVIDSFWDDRVPHVARHRGQFDHLFITDGELVDQWEAATGTPTSWLPFGTDALRVKLRERREFDLQRIGRQPSDWNDDADIASRASGLGLAYRGRLPYRDIAIENQRVCWAAMNAAKFTLSSSNLVSPEPYTHPTREYLTARWTDALAHGATVAGISPRCRATSELLWEGALLELDSLKVQPALRRVREAVDAWTPAISQRNHRMALERLDWRWRFAEICRVLDRSSPRLDAELGRLRARIEAAGVGPSTHA